MFNLIFYVIVILFYFLIQKLEKAEIEEKNQKVMEELQAKVKNSILDRFQSWLFVCVSGPIVC